MAVCFIQVRDCSSACLDIRFVCWAGHELLRCGYNVPTYFPFRCIAAQSQRSLYVGCFAERITEQLGTCFTILNIRRGDSAGT